MLYSFANPYCHWGHKLCFTIVVLYICVVHLWHHVVLYSFGLYKTLLSKRRLNFVPAAAVDYQLLQLTYMLQHKQPEQGRSIVRVVCCTERVFSSPKVIL